MRINDQNEGTKYRQSGDAGKLEASASMGKHKTSLSNKVAARKDKRNYEKIGTYDIESTPVYG